MLTHDYSYSKCLEGSVKNASTVEDCYQGRDFDFSSEGDDVALRLVRES